MKKTRTIIVFFTYLAVCFISFDIQGAGKYNPIDGKYVRMDESGCVTFLPRVIPSYTGAQYATAPFRTVGPVRIDESSGMPYRDVDTTGVSTSQLVEENGQESVLTEAPFENVKHENLLSSPYFACGRLEMLFNTSDSKKPKVFYGSAAAIQADLLITAAHNFMPDVFLGHPNTEKRAATTVHFQHQLVDNYMKKTHTSLVATHCFLHQKWKECFDQNFDIAFVFLSESIDEEDVQSGLLNLSVDKKDATLDIIGYPNGGTSMKKSSGRSRGWSEEGHIIYHDANTCPGNSGSPVVQDGKRLIGVHTRGKNTEGFNSGVKIRPDIINFMEECIEQYQKFLKDLHAVGEHKQLLEEQAKERLRKEGEERKTIEFVKKMILKGKTNKYIIEIIDNISQEKIDEIRSSFEEEPEHKRRRNEH